VSTRNLLPWMAIALCAHGAAFAASERTVPLVPPPTAPLEVELASLPEPEPTPAPITPDPAPDEAPPAPVARAPTKTAPRPVAPPPEQATAGKVGALLTAGETTDSADPVAFLSDPNGGIYGSGVVAYGGQAAHGEGPRVGHAVAAPAERRTPAGPVMPASDLSHAPSLDDPDACRGFFPADAAVDNAKVDLVVIVQANGRVANVSIARESPAGEGFGAAARACLFSKRFAPGVDRAGRAVMASAAVRLHFTR
jgi:periplasmic protein TonB